MRVAAYARHWQRGSLAGVPVFRLPECRFGKVRQSPYFAFLARFAVGCYIHTSQRMKRDLWRILGRWQRIKRFQS